MKHAKHRNVVRIFFVVFFGFTSLFAQLRLGEATFAYMNAPTLSNPHHLKIGLPSQKFLQAVGGVAFDAVASPTDGLKIESLSLNYFADSADGNRFWLQVNGKSVATRISDWMLVPIANFANSESYSCFTLFGKLTDPDEEKEVLRKHGKIMNYHPALTNTLLGLRILQQDMLILNNDCTDLPKDGDRYILGNGESEPNVWENQMGMNDFITHLNQVESEVKTRFRSYVVCDFERDIRFDIGGDSLSFTGEPFYYFWRYKSDSREYDQKKTQRRIETEIKNAIKSERAESPSTFSEREWYTNALLQQVREYEERYNFYSAGTIVDLLSLPDESARRVFLDRYQTAAIRILLVQMRTSMDAFEPIYLKDYSRRISDRPEIIRGINPTVWEAASNLMRYAALFRFCKQHYPEDWKIFHARLQNVEVMPKVVTPTVMYEPNRTGRTRSR